MTEPYESPGTSPRIIERSAQPYVGVRELVTMTTFNRIADRLPELFGWLGERGETPSGPPFFRYLTIDMERELDVEAGIPIAHQVAVSGPVFARTLPGGRFVTTTYVGHPDGLIEETDRLLRWADAQGLVWDVRDTPAGQAWGCRLEILLTDPAQEPDLNAWRTELAFRLADNGDDA